MVTDGVHVLYAGFFVGNGVGVGPDWDWRCGGVLLLNHGVVLLLLLLLLLLLMHQGVVVMVVVQQALLLLPLYRCCHCCCVLLLHPAARPRRCGLVVMLQVQTTADVLRGRDMHTLCSMGTRNSAEATAVRSPPPFVSCFHIRPN